MGTRILTTLYDYLGEIHFTEQSLLTSKHIRWKPGIPFQIRLPKQIIWKLCILIF